MANINNEIKLSIEKLRNKLEYHDKLFGWNFALLILTIGLLLNLNLR